MRTRPEPPDVPPRSRLPACREERGLTTLEWLLIVAAVSGLAALAVVMISRIVDDTGEQIADTNPMIRAAVHAGRELDLSARTERFSGVTNYAEFRRVTGSYASKCQRLNILHDHIPEFKSRWIGTPAPSWADPSDLEKNIRYWQLGIGRSDNRNMGGCFIRIGEERSRRSYIPDGWFFQGWNSRNGVKVRSPCFPNCQAPIKNEYWVPDLNNLSPEDQRHVDSLK